MPLNLSCASCRQMWCLEDDSGRQGAEVEGEPGVHRGVDEG